MKPWKQIKIFTCDAEQSAIIEPNENQNGITFRSCEENDKNKSFLLYMTKEEAMMIGEELIKYAQSL